VDMLLLLLTEVITKQLVSRDVPGIYAW
jgi:hypothetical protein